MRVLEDSRGRRSANGKRRRPPIARCYCCASFPVGFHQILRRSAERRTCLLINELVQRCRVPALRRAIRSCFLMSGSPVHPLCPSTPSRYLSSILIRRIHLLKSSSLFVVGTCLLLISVLFLSACLFHLTLTHYSTILVSFDIHLRTSVMVSTLMFSCRSLLTWTSA